MLDAQDLRAIAELIEQKNREMESRLREEIHGVEAQLREEIHGVEAQLREEIHGVEAQLREEIQTVKSELMVIIESDVMPKINLIAEAVVSDAEKVRRDYVTKKDFDIFRDRLEVVEVVVQQHTHELAKLKSA